MFQDNLAKIIECVKHQAPHYAPILDRLPMIVDHCELGYEVTTGLKFKYSFCVSDEYAEDDQLLKSHILRCCHDYNDGLWELLQPAFMHNRHAQLKSLHTPQTPIDIVIAPFYNSKNFICLAPSTYMSMQMEDRYRDKLYELITL